MENMGTGIKFEDINLDAPGKLKGEFIRNGKVYTDYEEGKEGNKTLVKERTKAITDYREFYLDHMIDQFFRHGRVDGKVYINFDEVRADDLWGYVGGELGREITKVFRERNNMYSLGCCVVPFGNTLSIAALKLSENPSVKVDMKIDSERISKQEIKEFLENFSSEAGIDVFLTSYPLQLVTPLSRVGNRSIYDVGSTDKEHHILEAGFKALANAFHYLKGKKSGSLVFQPTLKRQRIASRERDTHETQISLNLNLDGMGKDELELYCRLPSDVVDSFRQAHSYMIRASRFDINGKCVGDDEHHTLEDFGITEGEAITKGLEKRGTIKGIMRYGYDAQVCGDCGKFALAAIDIIRRPCYAANLPSSPRREQQLFSHYFEQLFENTGIDGYIATDYLDTVKGIFDEEIYANISSIFTKDSPYQLASNSIKGDYNLQTKCDDKYHQNELLFVALGRSLRQATRVDKLRASYLPTTKGLM